MGYGHFGGWVGGWLVMRVVGGGRSRGGGDIEGGVFCWMFVWMGGGPLGLWTGLGARLVARGDRIQCTTLLAHSHGRSRDKQDYLVDLYALCGCCCPPFTPCFDRALVNQALSFPLPLAFPTPASRTSDDLLPTDLMLSSSEYNDATPLPFRPRPAPGPFGCCLASFAGLRGSLRLEAGEDTFESPGEPIAPLITRGGGG